MVRKSWWLAMSVLGACASPTATTPPVPEQPDLRAAQRSDVLARVGREIDCTESQLRALCRLREAPTPLVLPDRPTSWLGLQVAVRRSRTLESGAFETMRLAELVLTPEGASVGRYDHRDLLPGKQYMYVLSKVLDATQGSDLPIEMPQRVFDLLANPPADTPATTRDGEVLRVEGEFPAEVWHVDASELAPAMWLAMEHTPGGVMVSLYPEAPWVVP